MRSFLLISALCLSAAACTTVHPARSFVTAADANLSVVTECTQAREGQLPDRALSCAGALEREYAALTEVVANNRRGFRYGEVALSTITLGLAGFEAHMDTLKAIGLIAGATEASRLTAQLPEQIQALDTASQRFRCVYEKGSSARNAMASASEQRDAIRATGTGKRGLVSASFLMVPASEDAASLHEAIMDAISRTEVSAIRELRADPPSTSVADTIKKAIDDAQKLGSDARQKDAISNADMARQGVVQGSAESLYAKRLLQEQTEYEKALIELAACPAT